MADAPSTETLAALLDRLERTLQAGINGLNIRLDRLVTNEVHSLYVQSTDRRLNDLAQDLAEERAARVAAQVEEKAERQKVAADAQTQLDKLTANIKRLTTGLIVPVVLIVVTELLRRV